jgi:hypothetical protein
VLGLTICPRDDTRKGQVLNLTGRQVLNLAERQVLSPGRKAGIESWQKDRY